MKWFCIIICVLGAIFLNDGVVAAPLRNLEQNNVSGSVDSGGTHPSFNFAILMSAAVIMVFVFVVAMCTCCQDGLMGIKPDDGYIANIEPPSTSTPGTPTAGRQDYNSAVTVEPLPDLSSPNVAKFLKPPGYNHAINKGISAQDWFTGKFEDRVPMENFPRQKLHYIREIRNGWFGNVVEGESHNLRKQKVVVKILREDATSFDVTFFLYEARMYRDANHPNVLKFVGKCTNTEPYLLILEHSVLGDLKTYLLNHRAQADQLITSGALFTMCLHAASGLCYLHENNFIHYDFACRNCVVFENNVVKIGDYGISSETYKDDYLPIGDTAVPLRWWAPESLECGSGVIVTKDLTSKANVWSFGVTLWEIMEFGKLPYMELKNDDVIDKVYRHKQFCLSQPLTPIPKRERMFQICQFCCDANPEQRPTMKNVKLMLEYIADNRNAFPSPEFDKKWSDFVPSHAKPLVGSASPIPPDPNARVLEDVPLKKEVTFLASGINPPAKPPRSLDSSQVHAPEFAIASKEVENQMAQLEAMGDATPAFVPKPSDTKSLQDDADRKRFLSLTGPKECLLLSKADLDRAAEVLTSEEYAKLQGQLEQAQEFEKNEQSAKELLTLSDAELMQVPDCEFKTLIPLLNSTEQISLEERKSRLNQKQEYILGCSGEALLSMEHITYNDYMGLLSPKDQTVVADRLEDAKETERLRQRWREKLLNLDGIELWEASQSHSFHEGVGFLGPEEQSTVLQRLDDIKLKRETLLSSEMTGHDVSEDQMALYLTGPEKEGIKQRLAQAKQKALRDEILSAQGLDLLDLYQNRYDDFLLCLTNEEKAGIVAKVEELKRCRSHILSLDDIELGKMSRDSLEGFREALSEPEWAALIDKHQKSEAHRSEMRTKLLTMNDIDLFMLVQSEGLENYLCYLNDEESIEMTQRLSTIEDMRNKLLGDAASESTMDYGDEMIAKYLTPMELTERRERKAESLRQEEKRCEILGAKDAELFHLYQDRWDDYFPYLSAEERAGIVGFVDNIREQRQLFLNMGDSELALIPAEQLASARKYFDDDEFSALQRRWDQIQGERDAVRNEVLTADDATLLRLSEDGQLEATFSDLNQEEILRVTQNVEAGRKKRDDILSMEDKELSLLDPETINDVMALLSPEQQLDLQERLERVANQEAEMEAEQQRAYILKQKPLDLALMSEEELGPFMDVLSEEEWEDLLMHRKEACEAREGILSLMDSGDPIDLPPESLSRYRGYLTPDEIELLDQKVLESSMRTPPEASLSNGDVNEFLAAPPSGPVHTSTPENGGRKPPAGVSPLTLAKGLASDPLPSPLSTPKDREVYEKNRSAIVGLSDAELRKVPFQEIDSFHSLLTMDESFDLRDRVSRLKSEALSYGSPVSVKSSLHSVLSTDVNSPSLSLVPEHEGEFESPWDARKHILELSDEQLAQLSSHRLEEFFVYLNMEEVGALTRRRDDCRNEKRMHLLHATDHDLRAMSDEQRSMYLSCVENPDELKNLSARLEHVPAMTSVTSESEIDIEKWNDPAAFKNYLATTQVSLSTAPTDSEAGPRQSVETGPVFGGEMSDVDPIIMKHIGNAESKPPTAPGQPLFEELRDAVAESKENAKSKSDSSEEDESKNKKAIQKLDVVDSPDIPYYPEHQDEMAGWVIPGENELPPIARPAGTPPEPVVNENLPIIDFEPIPPPKVAPRLGPGDHGVETEGKPILAEDEKDPEHESLTVAIGQANLSPIPSRKPIAADNAKDAGANLLDLFDPLIDSVDQSPDNGIKTDKPDQNGSLTTNGTGENSSLLLSSADTSRTFDQTVDLNRSFGDPFEQGENVPELFGVASKDTGASSMIEEKCETSDKTEGMTESRKSSSGSDAGTTETEEYEDVENPDGTFSRVLVKKKIKKRYKPWSPVVTSSGDGGVSYQWVPTALPPSEEDETENADASEWHDVVKSDGTVLKVKKRQKLSVSGAGAPGPGGDKKVTDGEDTQ